MRTSRTRSKWWSRTTPVVAEATTATISSPSWHLIRVDFSDLSVTWNHFKAISGGMMALNVCKWWKGLVLNIGYKLLGGLLETCSER